MNPWNHFGAICLLVSLFSCGGGSGGSGNAQPLPPTNLTLSEGSNFDEVLLFWTPPGTPVDGYTVEDRIDSDPWTLEPALIPGDAIGVQVSLAGWVPELAQLGCRLRSVKDGAYSSYTPEASLLHGLRPASGLVAHTLTEDVQLSWTRGSQVAEHVLVERAIWDAGQGHLGDYVPIATLNGSATSYLDQPMDGPAFTYGYRISYSTLHNGLAVQSKALEMIADAWTTLSPPGNLQASVTAQGVHLAWVPTSRTALGQVVERATAVAASDGEFAALAFLGPSASTYTDPAGPGPYTYRVRATTSPIQYGYPMSTPAEASLVIPPPPGPWNLQTQPLIFPLGDGLARSVTGAWHVAANWSMGTPYSMGFAIWRPTGSTFEKLTTGLGRFATPGVVLDTSGHPHALTFKDPGGVVVPHPMVLTHTWHNGIEWQEEAIATRQFESGNVRYAAEFAMDATDKLHVLWKATQVANQQSSTLLEYGTNATGSWVVSNLPVSLVADLGNVQGFRLAVSPNGTLYAALAANTNSLNNGSLLLLRKPEGGSWVEELALIGSVYLWDEVPFAIVPQDSERAGIFFQQTTSFPNPNEFRYAARTATGWGPSERVGEFATGSGYKVANAAALPGGSRVAALFPAPTGTTLVTWDAAHGWTSTLVRPPDPFAVPWLSFDALGNLHALMPAGNADPDGFAPWIHLTATP